MTVNRVKKFHCTGSNFNIELTGGATAREPYSRVRFVRLRVIVRRGRARGKTRRQRRVCGRCGSHQRTPGSLRERKYIVLRRDEIPTRTAYVRWRCLVIGSIPGADMSTRPRAQKETIEANSFVFEKCVLCICGTVAPRCVR